ncbi:FIST C domain protein [compost metagenome]
MKVNPDQSITFYTELMPNTFVHMLKPEDPIAILRQTLGKVPFKPVFVLAVHCILRSMMFQQNNCWSAYDRELLGLSRNITGFIIYGEQYYQRHANQTMVLLLTE